MRKKKKTLMVAESSECEELSWTGIKRRKQAKKERGIRRTEDEETVLRCRQYSQDTKVRPVGRNRVGSHFDRSLESAGSLDSSKGDSPADNNKEPRLEIPNFSLSFKSHLKWWYNLYCNLFSPSIKVLITENFKSHTSKSPLKNKKQKNLFCFYFSAFLRLNYLQKSYLTKLSWGTDQYIQAISQMQ